MRKIKKEINKKVMEAEFPYYNKHKNKPALTIQNYANCLIFCDLFEAKFIKKQSTEFLGHRIFHNRFLVSEINSMIKEIELSKSIPINFKIIKLENQYRRKKQRMEDYKLLINEKMLLLKMFQITVGILMLA